MEPIAKFKFDGYLITKSLLEISDASPSPKDLSIDFNLRGLKRDADKKFELTMEVAVADKTGTLTVNVVAVGEYTYDDDCGEELLGSFLNMNAPAILFPYIRAHIATLSTLCGFAIPILLPTLNLSNLAQQLSANTETV